MTKTDFARIPELRKAISRELMLWENAIEAATGNTYALTGMPHGSGATSKVENCVVKADDHYTRYLAYCDELSDIWKRLKRDIVRYRLSEDEVKVVTGFYPQGRRAADLAREMKVTERHVWRLKQTALKKLCPAG